MGLFKGIKKIKSKSLGGKVASKSPLLSKSKVLAKAGVVQKKPVRGSKPVAQPTPGGRNPSLSQSRNDLLMGYERPVRLDSPTAPVLKRPAQIRQAEKMSALAGIRPKRRAR